MSGYEADHNLPQFSSTVKRRARRPDAATLLSNLNQINDAENNTPTETHPSQMSFIYREATNYYQVMNGETDGVALEHNETIVPQHNDLLSYMIEILSSQADQHLTHTQGVPNGYIDELQRVSKAELQRRAKEKKGDTCAICSEPFMDDEFPLVVRLPCHTEHIYDLQCIRPWLELNVTCPLDRKELVKVETDEERLARFMGKRPGQAKTSVDDEEEDEFDGLYG